MAVEGLVGEAWILIRPNTASFAPQLRKDLAGSMAVIDSEMAATGGLIGPGAVAATERSAATAGEKAAAAFSGRFTKLGKTAVTGLGGALLGGFALAEGIKSTVKASVAYGTATAQIAANTGQTEKQVASLGDAFVQTAKAGDLTFKAGEVATAYGAVAGQLKVTEGHVLSNRDALRFMRQAELDAEASGADLASTTGALAATMQAFHIPISGVNTEADQLFNVARALNVPITQVSTAVDRLHSRLGVAAPSLADTGALMVSFGKAGVSGQRGLMVVNSALSTLLSTSSTSAGKTKASAMQIEEARIAEQVATDNVTKALVTYGKKSEQYVIAVERQKIAASKFKQAQTPVAGALTASQKEIKSLGVEVYDSHGKFVGMTSIIEQLAPKLAKMSDKQRQVALSTLFGKTAAQLMGTVIAQGIPGWNKATAAVTKHGTAQYGAEQKEKTLAGQTGRLSAQFNALEIELGQKVTPVVAATVGWFVHHQNAATALAAVIGGVLTLAVARYVGKLLWATGETTVAMARQVAGWLGLTTTAEASAAEIAVANTEIAGTTSATAGTVVAETAVEDAALEGVGVAAGAGAAEVATADAAIVGESAAAEGAIAAEMTAASLLGPAFLAAAAGVASYLGTTALLKNTGLGDLVTHYIGHDLFGRSESKPSTSITQSTKDYLTRTGQTQDTVHARRVAEILSGQGLGGKPSTPAGWHAPMAAPTYQNLASINATIATERHAQILAAHQNTTNALLIRSNFLLSELRDALRQPPARPNATQRRFMQPELQ